MYTGGGKGGPRLWRETWSTSTYPPSYLIYYDLDTTSLTLYHLPKPYGIPTTPMEYHFNDNTNVVYQQNRTGPNYFSVYYKNGCCKYGLLLNK